MLLPAGRRRPYRLNSFLISQLIRLDLDSVAEPFFPGDRGADYAEKIEPKVVTAVLNLARFNLEAGQSVLVEATWFHLFHSHPEYLHQVKSFLEETQVRWILLEGVLSRQEILKRIEHRNHPRDFPKLKDPEEFFRISR